MGFEGGEKELTGPHEDGAMRVFNLAKDNGISRIILTSSVASIWMDSTIDDTVRYIDENNWTNLSDANLDAYTKGKALKEKAAWDFVDKNDSIKLTTILPSIVFGPGIGSPVRRGSLELFLMLIKNEMPVAPPLKVGVVDVRDVAWMHAEALENEHLVGERLMMSSTPITMPQIARILKEKGWKVTTRTLPNFVVRFMALFIKEARLITSGLGTTSYYDCSNTQNKTGWVTKSHEEMVLSAAESLRDQ